MKKSSVEQKFNKQNDHIYTKSRKEIPRSLEKILGLESSLTDGMVWNQLAWKVNAKNTQKLQCIAGSTSECKELQRRNLELIVKPLNTDLFNHIN